MCVHSGIRRVLASLAVMAAVAGPALGAYSVGQKAANFTLKQIGTNNYVSLYDFADHVIVLDFFAYWCGPCKTASAELEPYIQEYYEQRGGNPDGVPVQLLSLSIDSSSPSSVNSYINTYGLQMALDDGNWSAYSRYSTGSIPQFAIINGVQDGNYDPWEIIYLKTGYGSGGYSTFRTYINRVQMNDPPPPLPGDLDANGLVAGGDLDIIRANWGRQVEAGALNLGDASGDGIVNATDLDIVRANWGARAAAAVPEPASVVLLAFAAAALRRTRPGRKRC